MLKSIIAFCLSRRAIIIMALLAFAGAGYLAFNKLNIEAYPNPTPVILEITAQAPGALGRGDGKVLHHSHRNRTLHDARH
jgi:Cu/Ag efflux pump CusA